MGDSPLDWKQLPFAFIHILRNKYPWACMLESITERHSTAVAKVFSFLFLYFFLTLWGRVTHLCASKLTSIAGILLIGPLVTNFSQIISEIHTFSFKKMRLNMSSGNWRPFCLGLNVFKHRVVHEKNVCCSSGWCVYPLPTEIMNCAVNIGNHPNNYSITYTYFFSRNMCTVFYFGDYVALHRFGNLWVDLNVIV